MKPLVDIKEIIISVFEHECLPTEQLKEMDLQSVTLFNATEVDLKSIPFSGFVSYFNNETPEPIDNSRIRMTEYITEDFGKLSVPEFREDLEWFIDQHKRGKQFYIAFSNKPQFTKTENSELKLRDFLLEAGIDPEEAYDMENDFLHDIVLTSKPRMENSPLSILEQFQEKGQTVSDLKKDLMRNLSILSSYSIRLILKPKRVSKVW